MKTKFFFFAMFVNIVANATVTVTPISTDYANRKVTFRVAWTGSAHNNRVWVWVDLCPVVGSTPSTFAQGIISAASATAGSIATVAGNQRGFYVTTNPSTLTATLSNANGKFNWCAYGSDYPPNATSYNNGTYTLRGTQPFVITGNGTIQAGNKYVGTVINSLTDATGYPGGVWRDQPHNGGSCVPGLTAVGNYCRDLVADGASTYVGCGYEFRFSATAVLHTQKSTACPSGWHVATKSEVTCIRGGDAALINSFVFWVAYMPQAQCDVYCDYTGNSWCYYYCNVPNNCDGTATPANVFWCVTHTGEEDTWVRRVACVR
jgi:hypothetical protein